jgi:predicted porin
MVRSLIAAAVLATLGTSALAQSSVTMYGRLNLTLESQKIVDGLGGERSARGLINNASRIGMKGTEDLGGGLKAGFQIEHGFDADTGAATGGAAGFWGRQSEVNLSGSFGMVRLGNFTSEAYYATADYVSLHNHDTGTSADTHYAYLGRNTDKIAYRTPDMGGFTAEAAISLRDGNPAPADRTIDLAVNYGAGPLHIGAGYEKAGDAKQFAVSGLYEAGAITFGGYFQRASGAGLDRNSFRLVGMYTMGNTELHANFGYAGKIDDVDGTAANQLTLGVNYNLSKRTKIYGFYTNNGGDAGDAYALLANRGVKRSLAAGVRHNF